MTAAPQSIESGHHDVVHDVQMDYYGKRIATCSSDRTIKVFSVTGDQHAHLADLTGKDTLRNLRSFPSRVVFMCPPNMFPQVGPGDLFQNSRHVDDSQVCLLAESSVSGYFAHSCWRLDAFLKAQPSAVSRDYFYIHDDLTGGYSFRKQLASPGFYQARTKSRKPHLWLVRRCSRIRLSLMMMVLLRIYLGSQSKFVVVSGMPVSWSFESLPD